MQSLGLYKAPLYFFRYWLMEFSTLSVKAERKDSVLLNKFLTIFKDQGLKNQKKIQPQNML